MEHDFSWMYLIFFLMIPLARIIPRILARMRRKDNTFQTVQENQHQSNAEEQSAEYQREYQREEERHKTKDMLVLGEINNGAKTFEIIQKRTQIENKELDSILEELENSGLMRVVQKQGLLGAKIEILPTDKGFNKYYS